MHFIGKNKFKMSSFTSVQGACFFLFNAWWSWSCRKAFLMCTASLEPVGRERVAFCLRSISHGLPNVFSDLKKFIELGKFDRREEGEEFGSFLKT